MSETTKRVLSAVVGLPVYVFLFTTDAFYSLPILIISLIVSLACLYEFYKICDKGTGHSPNLAGGMALGAAVNVVMYLYAFGRVLGFAPFGSVLDARLILSVLAVALTAFFAWQIFRRPIEGGIYSLSTTVFGVIFIALGISHMILLKSIKDGTFYIFALNIVVMLNDTGAYFGGKNFGKHKAGIRVSPNKSWEGYFSGLLVSIIAMMVTAQVFESFFGRSLFSMIESVLLGIALSVLGNIGDLIESAVKRDGSTKDSGSIIPGHGGLWDVFDALVLTTPLFYYYLIIRGVQ